MFARSLCCLLVLVASTLANPRSTSIQNSFITSITTFQASGCASRGTPGPICMDCNILGTCVFRNNMWEAIPLEICDETVGMYCHQGEGKCSTTLGVCNPLEGNFVCSSEGVFPDPHNCQAFHMCHMRGNTFVAANVLCTGNSAFDPATGSCSINIAHEICNNVQFNCQRVGQMAPWPTNANIFYICMATSVNGNRVLFPNLFRCPNGQYFDNDKQACGTNGNGGGSSFNCPSPGLFKDPSNCNFYFFCNGNLSAQRIQCPTGTFFDTVNMGCMRGTC